MPTLELGWQLLLTLMVMERPTLPSTGVARVPGISILPEVDHLMGLGGVEMPRINQLPEIMTETGKQTLPFTEVVRVPGSSFPLQVLHLMDSVGVEMPRTNLFPKIMTVMERPTMQCTGMVRGLFPL